MNDLLLSPINTPINKSKNLEDFAKEFNLSIPSDLFDKKISGLALNSSEVESDNIFFALKGDKFDGNDFIDAALKNGAILVLSDNPRSNHCYLPNLRFQMGSIAKWFFDDPLQNILTVGITGTNGKTTTTELINQIWTLAGKKSARIGTLGGQILNLNEKGNFTTPESLKLYKFFAQAKGAGIFNLVMEVSSHALFLNRVSGVKYDLSVFTNLTQDHLDFHKDMESYFLAKAKLFTPEYSNLAIINLDDPYGKRLIENIEIPYLTYSRFNSKANWYYEQIQPVTGGYQIVVRGESGILIQSYLPLLGDFNLDNYLAAIATTYNSGIDPLVIQNVTSELKSVPGRLEQISVGQNFLALVDFAHSPDAVINTLANLRNITNGKIIAVLGCGGDRDKLKRPLMGNALVNGSDIAIFTSDNPRSENPEDILQDMLGNLIPSEKLSVISERKKAIAFAVNQAKDGDCVILLGKGHETGQIIQGQVLAFDDRVELATAIKKKMEN